MIVLNNHVSYAKLMRFTTSASKNYEIVIESWCDPCPVTAILWGVDELPVFVPHVTLLDSRGDEVTTIAGRVWQQEPIWRSQPLKGEWHLHLQEPGLYYLLITSESHQPTVVGYTRNFIGYVASPIGKIRVAIADAP